MATHPQTMAADPTTIATQNEPRNLLLTQAREIRDRIYDFVFEGLTLVPVWQNDRPDVRNLKNSRRALLLALKDRNIDAHDRVVDFVVQAMWRQATVELDSPEKVAAFILICPDGNKVHYLAIQYPEIIETKFRLMRKLFQTLPNLKSLRIYMKGSVMVLNTLTHGTVEEQLEDPQGFFSTVLENRVAESPNDRHEFMRCMLREANDPVRERGLEVVFEALFRQYGSAVSQQTGPDVPFRFNSTTWTLDAEFDDITYEFSQTSMDEIDNNLSMPDRDIHGENDKEEKSMLDCFKELYPFRPMNPESLLSLYEGWDEIDVDNTTKPSTMWTVARTLIGFPVPSNIDEYHYIWSRILLVEDTDLLARPYKWAHVYLCEEHEQSVDPQVYDFTYERQENWFRKLFDVDDEAWEEIFYAEDYHYWDDS